MKKRTSTFPALTIIYVALISAWFMSWLLVGDRHWWLILVNRIVPYLFIPVPIFLAWSIFSCNFRVVIPLVLPILIFANLYHPYLMPKFSQADSTESPLRVMTYNVLYTNLNYDTVANVILVHQPDLVALQEVQPAMMDALEERLAADYPYSKMGTVNPFGTTAVFSHYPFTTTHILNLQPDRPAVIVRTRVHEKEITFVAVHLLAYGLQWVEPKDIPAAVMKRTADQNRQVEILLEAIQDEKGTVIIGCDCNSKETSSSYRILAEHMKNSARDIGWLVSRSELQNVRPDVALQHIDYVWYRGSLKPVRVHKVNNSGGSDHLPVLALFDLEENLVTDIP